MTTGIAGRRSMAELALYLLRLGFRGFGGLVGQMERELVNDKKWLSKDEMRQSIAICQSLPGPLAIRVGISHGCVAASGARGWAAGASSCPIW
jgi:chromate transporter